MARVSKVNIPTDEEFKDIVQKAFSYSDCLRALGLSPKGGSSTKILKKRIESLGLSTSHFTGSIPGNATRKYSDEELFVENSAYVGIARMKIRIIRDGLLDYVCAECGNTGEWNGKKITLQLDHINGTHNDHRLTNLRFLCPNCHSQTETYAGKNK